MTNDIIAQLLEGCHNIAQTHRRDLLRQKALEALAISPGHPEALRYLCLAANDTGNYEELKAAAEEGVRLHPQESRFFYYLYLYYLALGGPLYRVACNLIQEALRLSPQNAGYHRELGEVYLVNWEPEKARIALREAARIDPSNGEIVSRLGIAELRCGNFREAFRLARSSLPLAPDDFNVYNNCGQIFLFGGELEEAEAMFREALRRFPTYEYFQRQLSNCEREKTDRAQRLAKKLRYTPLVRRQKGRKRFFDEDAP